ncbi:DNA-formamidopyrimidine glycosylase family protein [Caproicibacter sp.]|uniref:DNA-formamidopyrimidine glycosylase family protein n=1 Tax=Caproicibacter sp. TaxID=2814884 RepID=UPI00398A25F3
MMELPESTTIARQMNDAVVGKRIRRVLPPTKAHKFCWYAGDPAEYDAAVSGSTAESAEGFGIFAELAFDNGKRLCFNDGVNARLINCDDAPKNYQLLMEFDDGTALVFTVAMYGGIILHDGTYDNEYYLKSRTAVSPFSEQFEPYYRKRIAESKPNLSAKAFLATEQRFPGIGNGVLQDILFAAGIHPKRKIGTFSEAERDCLLSCIVSVLHDMTQHGGRDTEKDLFGCPGGYRVKLSKNTLASGCPRCGGQLVKEAYLGGAVYSCPSCQPLMKE